MQFGTKLLEIRKEMGFSSARAFYLNLSEKTDLEFNYAYYKKIENNEKLPSVKIVHHLVALLPKAYGNELVLSFCHTQFPEHGEVFKAENKPARPAKKKADSKKTIVDHTHIGQKELTERQIAVIAKSEFHFYLFSIITLSRRPLKKSELLKFFTEEDLSKATLDLAAVKLVQEDADLLISSYPEYKYPKAYSDSLKKHYALLDEYELKKLSFFQLEKKTRAQFFRRISPRYLDLIVNHIDLLYQTIRMSDDFDANQNETVCALSVRLDSGVIPG